MGLAVLNVLEPCVLGQFRFLGWFCRWFASRVGSTLVFSMVSIVVTMGASSQSHALFLDPCEAGLVVECFVVLQRRGITCNVGFRAFGWVSLLSTRR